MFDDAEFLSCIEDQYYREDQSERKISKELVRIMIGDTKCF